MEPLSDIHATASAWFAVKIANGKVPEVVLGGDLDGLRYFETVIEGVSYWVTEAGLFTPPGRTDAPLVL